MRLSIGRRAYLEEAEDEEAEEDDDDEEDSSSLLESPKRDDTLSAAVVEPNSPAQGNVRRRKGEGSKTGSTGYKSETQTWESNKEYERTT